MIKCMIKKMATLNKLYINSLKNGWFENDQSFWTRPSNTPNITTINKKEGNKSIAWLTVSTNYTNIHQTVNIASGHKVYVSYWFNIPVLSGGSFYAQVLDGLGNSLGYLQPPASTTVGWVRMSGVFTLANPNLKILFATSNLTGTVYVDAAMFIELTDKFGVGHEPTKAWCDSNITIDNVTW
jgi:hypothetical protein